MHITHVGVNDGILSTQEEHCLLGIFGVGNLLVPQGVRGPIEVPLEEVGNAKLHADEVFDDEIQALIFRAVSNGCSATRPSKHTFSHGR